MPVFQINVQANEMVETEDPIITVDAGLPPGQYLFQLVVENEKGIKSLPAQTVVTVRQAATPQDGDRRLVDEG